MRLNLFLFAGLVAGTAAPSAFPISLTNFNQLVVFGDSLSDTGNNYIATNGRGLDNLGTNYWAGRFTDGPTTTPATDGPIGNWVDQFSARAGFANSMPSLAGGTNYAFGGASTGSAQYYDIGNQLADFSSAHPAGGPSGALYVFWGGANDLRDPGVNPAAAADSLYQNILTLAAGDSKTFLWFNLPGSTGLAATFNAQWSLDLQELHEAGINVIGVNVSNLFTRINANPATFGFTDVTNPAQGLTGVNPNNYLFWDTRRHPTTATHALIADLAFSDVVNAPEPFNVGLVLAGLAGFLSLRQFRRKH